jgi:hypothetical protein
MSVILRWLAVSRCEVSHILLKFCFLVRQCRPRRRFVCAVPPGIGSNPVDVATIQSGDAR